MSEEKVNKYSFNRVAAFTKVSRKQFFKDWKETFREEYSDEKIKEIYDNIKIPTRGTKGSAGYDFFAPVHIILEPGKSFKIPTGIRCSIMGDWFLGIFPRSGQGFKYGIKLSNTTGIIDSDYFSSDNEGHIMIKFLNDSCIGKAVDIPVGQGMAQGIFLPYGLTFDDNVTDVRNGGFGSTTKRE